MLSRRVSSCVLCLVLVVVAGGAVAQPPGPPPGPPPGGFHFMGEGPGGFGDGPGMLLPLMLRAGDLTPEQEQKVRTIMSGDRARIHELFDQIDKANDSLAAKLVSPGAVDAAALTPDVDRIAGLRTELLKEGLQSALAIRAVLTPEQLARAAQKRARMTELQTQMRELMNDK